MQIAFNDLPLDHRILKALEIKGFEFTTEIQQQSIPHALQGKDLLASSKTGSGKTLAFLLPALQRVLKQKALSKKDPRVLILAPTRELAKQVFLQLKWLLANQRVNAALILGGENFNDQVKALKRNPEFVIGTPGRVADHVKDKSLFLNGLELLIMDEADRMLDLGFSQELNLIHQKADHRKRQTMMFSATLDNAELHHLTQKILNAPQRVSVGLASDQHEDITQNFYFSDGVSHKEQILLQLLAQVPNDQIIIFVATRDDTQRLSQWLNTQSLQSVALSAGLTQSQRSNIMNSFSMGQDQILVTTDVASRGLDLLKVQMVINFDLPKLPDEYVHRIGRTGRAGNQGRAVSLVGPKDWAGFISIRAMLKQKIEITAFPGIETKFKGLAQKNRGTLAPKQAHKNKKAKPTNAPKRVKTQIGEEVGHAPLKRKPSRN